MADLFLPLTLFLLSPVVLAALIWTILRNFSALMRPLRIGTSLVLTVGLMLTALWIDVTFYSNDEDKIIGTDGIVVLSVFSAMIAVAVVGALESWIGSKHK